MALVLVTVRCPEGVGPDRREVAFGDLTIGRGAECDWVLPDPGKIMSKQHCRISARGDAWLVTDESANGTYLNGDALDHRLPHPLRANDRLAFGQYEVQVRIEAAGYDDPSDDPSDAPTRLSVRPERIPGREFTLSGDPAEASGIAGSRLTSDPFAPDEDDALEAARPSVGLPQDFDALVPAGDRIGERPFTASDDTPDLNAHFTPPRPSSDMLPEDWDLDVGEDLRTETGKRPFIPADLPYPPVAPVAEASAADGPAESLAESSPLPNSLPQPPPPRPDSAWIGLAAFLEGAQVQGGSPIEADATLRALGAAFRSVVSGLRESMIARAAVKNEFRIGQTMIRPAGNNPLKFSADDDDALAALLGIGRRSSISPAEAVAEALRDIRLHELASAAAMQGAVRELLSEISPERVTRGARRGALDGLLGRRKQAAWDAFAARHAEVERALGDDFDSVFGRAYGRAYEAALDAISAQDEGAPDRERGASGPAPLPGRTP